MPHMEGIFINGEKAKFHPEDILDTDASQYTEEIGESVTAFLTEHLTNPSNPPIDTSLSIAGAAADAKETGDEISQLKSDLKSAIIKSTDGIQTFYGLGNFQHYGLQPDGTFLTSQQYRVSNDDPMTFGRPLTISVKTGFRWGYIPFVDGAAGSWSGWKTEDFTIPADTSFVVQIARETEIQTEIADVSEFLDALTFLTKVGDDVNTLLPDHAFFEKTIVFTDGYKVRADTGVIEEDSVYSYTELSVAMLAGSSLTGYSNASPWPNQGLAFYDAEGKFISGAYNPTSGSYDWNISVIIPANAFTLRISCRTEYKDVFKLTFQWNKSNQNIENAIKITYDNNTNLETVNRILADTFIPVLRNGSAGNTGNANAISTDYIYPIDFTKDSIFIEYTGDASLADEYAWAYCKFSGATDGMKSATAFANTDISKAQYNQNATYRSSSTWVNIPTSELAGYDHIMFFLHRFKDGTLVPLRITSDQYSFRATWRNNEGIVYNDADFAKTKHDLLYAKHAKGNTGARLTLLHFSDLHKDTGALARIMEEAKFFAYDDAICTGDMVGDTYEQISSWWNASILTCIGNHDSASYSSSTGYNWTALSMANRSAYYIEPFESEWRITHTSGKSYYYKDYTDAKVRMIVMDAMLYNDNGQDATDQTTWLSGLLSSAIANNLHVLIAIHAPHGGAVAEDCSFSRYAQEEMPTHSDCNTPQVVIDAVASAMNTGLHFIGYIVGHTHQDNIWDAEGDGTQLMYCITCAAISNENQWKNSDQHRDTQNDAYNIVTIDTANTLIKIIRGGGANMDDHMRTRKAVCFNYSTGEKVGEVL